MIHGGDIYNNKIKLDFSVNINPLGVPDSVRKAITVASNMISTYPDYQQRALYRAVSDSVSVPEDELVLGNGASELFMAAVHALKPRKVIIPVPSFYGYEYAAKAAGSDIAYIPLGDRMEADAALPERIVSREASGNETGLKRGETVLFLANPNNPTGRLIDDGILMEILDICEEHGIYTVLDECFSDFCEGQPSRIDNAYRYRHLIIVKAYTKIFSIPGVRLGYAVCGDFKLSGLLRQQLPEWNISIFAQYAGIACATEKDFVRTTVSYVKTERNRLSCELRSLGATVYESDANFILIKADPLLQEKLLERGILIRDCSLYRGLGEGFFRIAVRSEEDNDILIKNIRETIQCCGCQK